jgi:pilus assembly protein Flp/PilA
MLGRFTRMAVAFLKEEDGPTAVEYAVMLALILVVIVAAVSNIGGTTSAMYNDLSLQGVKPGSSGTTSS